MKDSNVKMHKIGLNEYETKLIGKDIVEHKKHLSSVMSNIRKMAKQDACYYCGKAKTSFCNSHFVPAFCLRNIAVKGEVNYSNTLINLPLLDNDKGVNNAGTFNLICNECDSKIFSDYENPDNYDNIPSQKMIAQIAMKNYMKMISKRLFEISLYANFGEITPFSPNLLKQQQLVNYLDLEEYQKDYQKAKRLSLKDWAGEYYLFYFERLDYVVPIAFQGGIVLVSDLEGQLINDIYNMSPNYHTREVHICVFPLQNRSVIMMFIDSKDKRYKSFYIQFSKLTEDEKLALINYIIFSYSEDVFFSKKIPQEVLNNKRLIEITKTTTIATSNKPFKNAIEEAKQSFDLKKWRDVPNLLSNKYAIK